MNRRTALLSSLFLGGLVPARLLAQERGSRSSVPRTDRSRPASPADDETEADSQDLSMPAGLKGDPSFQLKKWDISRYTRIPNNVQAPPEKALIDWILLRTGLSYWHGEQATVLCANHKQLLAYNSPDLIKQVDEIVERFTDATEDTLRIQVQFIAAVDPRWRYTVYPRLTYVGGGPQGHQIWTMTSRDAALVLTQMQIQQGFRQLAKEGVEMINGQTLSIKTREPRTFVGGLAPDPGGGIAFQPRSDKIEEGIMLKLSPLLTYKGDAVDAKIDLTVNMVRTLHRTKVIAPRGEVGSIETTIDVPDATQTHIEQTVRNWKLGQSLIIAAGIHPGILDKKSGLFNLPIPGTYPTATEVLVFLDVETVDRGRTARGRARPTTRGRYDDEETAAIDRDPNR
jgi:hypothetical protein